MTKKISFPGMDRIIYAEPETAGRVSPVSAPDVRPNDLSKAASAPEAPLAPDLPPATFKDFFFLAVTGQVTPASKTLERLLGVDGYTARGYTNFFCHKLQTDPTTAEKTLRIKESIDNGQTNDALVLLSECFGMGIIEAITVLTALTVPR